MSRLAVWRSVRMIGESLGGMSKRSSSRKRLVHNCNQHPKHLQLFYRSKNFQVSFEMEQYALLFFLYRAMLLPDESLRLN